MSLACMGRLRTSRASRPVLCLTLITVSLQPYALAIAMFSIFMIFIVELIAFRWGTAKLASIGISHDPHGHGVGSHAAHGPEPETQRPDRTVLNDGTDAANALSWKDGLPEKSPRERDVELAMLTTQPSSVVDSPLTQIIGVAILEFGVLLHRYEQSRLFLFQH